MRSSLWFIEEASGEAYEKLIRYAIEQSDCFSLIDYRHRENDRVRKSAKPIWDGLRKYQIMSKRVHKWPTMETLDQKDIYKLHMYESRQECVPILLLKDNIWDWDYLDPADPCFYRNGYCWLAICPHERDASLYTDSEEELSILESYGVELVQYEWISEGKLFLISEIE